MTLLRSASRAVSGRYRRLPPRAGAAFRRLVLETLESRHLLAAVGLEQRESPVAPELFDSSSILVRFQPGTPGHAKAGIVPGAGLGPPIDLVPGLHAVELPPGLSVAAALATYRHNPNVIYAEPNYLVKLEATPNDPQFSQLWGLDNTGQTGGTSDADIDALEAWDTTTGSGTTVVAVIDTGVDYNHPDLAANIWTNPGEIAGNGVDDDGNGYVDDVRGFDFVNFDNNPLDDNGHGTHISGTIGAVGDNGVGVTGINWNVQIMPLKFLDSFGNGSYAAAIAAFDYAVEMGATISNNSWAGFGYSQALFDAIQSARTAGHIVVAAAGNESTNNDSVASYPANFGLDNIIAVAATDHHDNLANFSNYGATSVDLGAPGVNILSTLPGNSYDSFDGTSMATPHVSGVVALVRDQNPAWSYDQVVAQILTTVDPIPALAGKTVTGGRLNAAAAVGPAGPDIRGPRVLSTNPSGGVTGSVGSMRVTFNESIDVASFGPEDISGFAGPNGTLAVSNVTVVPSSNDRQFDITFLTQTAFGDYSLTIGPQITDVAGNEMNQDNDENNGELTADQYTATFSIVDVLILPSSDVPAPIQDWTFTISYLDVTRDEDIVDIADLNVQLDIQHSYVGDLEIYLAPPGASFPFGPYVELFLYSAGGANMTDTVFDDEASVPISAGTAPFTGSFRPEGSLSFFDGMSTQGTWQLWIGDGVFFDQGTLLGWQLIVSPEGGTPPPPPPPDNNAPVADNDGYATDEDQTLQVAAPGVLEGDTDLDGDPLTAVLVSQPSRGTLTLNANGSFTYSPDADYFGPDSFTYRASDGTTQSNLATVSLTVNPVNDAPVAVNDSATVDKDTAITFDGASGNPPPVEDNDTDVENDPLIIVSVQNSLHGSAVLQGDGTVTFTPEAGYVGPASFEYTVSDGGLTDVGLVQIDVVEVGDTTDYYFSTTAGGTLTGSGGTPLGFADADIVRLAVDGTGAYDFSLYFDGSDVGLATGNEDIDAFDILPDGSIVLSTVGSFSVPGPSGSGISISGTGSDLLLFIPTSLGSNTAGTWILMFDGSDVGLTRSSENVDGVSVLEDGRILVSATGNVSVSGASGNDKDLLAFTPTVLGTDTAGTWAMYFDGSDVDLSASSEDVDALFVDEGGGALPEVYLSTRGNFAVTGVSGTNDDIVKFTPTALGSSTSGSYGPGLALTGSQFGLSPFDLDGIHLGPAPGSASSSGDAAGTLAAAVDAALLIPDLFAREDATPPAAQPTGEPSQSADAAPSAAPGSVPSPTTGEATVGSRSDARQFDDLFALSADEDWIASRETGYLVRTLPRRALRTWG